MALMPYRPSRSFRSHVIGLLCISSLVCASASLMAQAPAAADTAQPQRRPQIGPDGKPLPGMPRFHEPDSYDINEHTGFKEIFDGKTFNGWDADTTIWHVEDGVMIGETLEGKPRGNNYIVYRGDSTKDFDLMFAGQRP